MMNAVQPDQIKSKCLLKAQVLHRSCREGKLIRFGLTGKRNFLEKKKKRMKEGKAGSWEEVWMSSRADF